VTTAPFRDRHQQALAGFLVQSLKLCADAGMVRVGTMVLDGGKLAGNAADKANHFRQARARGRRDPPAGRRGPST
jgi:hypothetical protein